MWSSDQSILARGSLEMGGCVMKEKQIRPTIFHQPHYGFTATLNENLALSCTESLANEKAFTSDLDTKMVTTYFMHATHAKCYKGWIYQKL